LVVRNTYWYESQNNTKPSFDTLIYSPQYVPVAVFGLGENKNKKVRQTINKLYLHQTLLVIFVVKILIVDTIQLYAEICKKQHKKKGILRITKK
jgi:hypothetical protein